MQAYLVEGSRKAIEKNEDTHLSLAGGKYFIEDDSLKGFYKAYLKESYLSKINTTFYLCEVRKEVFNLFFDIDIEMSNSEIKINYRKLVQEISHLLKELFITELDDSVSNDNSFFFIDLVVLELDFIFTFESLKSVSDNNLSFFILELDFFFVFTINS